MPLSEDRVAMHVPSGSFCIPRKGEGSGLRLMVAKTDRATNA